MSGCRYNNHWRGKCNNPTVDNSEYCDKHKDKKCRVCSNQATRACPAATSLVCGVPLCDDHSHIDHK